METITLTMEEQTRVEVIQRIFRGEMTMAEAATVLGVSERHSYRIKARMRKEGVRGVIHGNRGRHSDRKLPTQIKRRIVELARGAGATLPRMLARQMVSLQFSSVFVRDRSCLWLKRLPKRGKFCSAGCAGAERFSWFTTKTIPRKRALRMTSTR